MADGTEYEIRIAANAVGADSSVEQLNQLASKIESAGAVSTQFDSALERTKALLAESAAASTAAADAVGAGEAKYRELETAANKAGKAVERAAAAGKDTSSLVAARDAAVAAMNEQAASLDQLRAKADAAKGAESELASTMKTLEGAAKGAAKGGKESAANIEQMTYLAKGAMGPMGGLFEKSTLLFKGLTQGGLAGAAVLASVAIVALTASLFAGVAAMAQYAVSCADAAIKQRALLEGAVGPAGAGAVVDAVNAIKGATPQAASEITKLGEQLYQTGLRGKKLEDALLKASLKAAGLEKASPVALQKRMANLDVQAIKFKEHIADIFAGPSTVAATEKFEGALLKLNDLFGENTATGYALRTLVATIVDPLIAGIAKAQPYATALFRGLVLGAIQVAIVVVKVRNAVAGMIPEGVLGNVDTMATLMTVGRYAAYGIAAGIAALAIAFTVVAGVIGVAVASVLAIPGAFMAVGYAAGVVVRAIVDFGAQVWDTLSNLGSRGTEAAGALIQGLIGGITSGAGMVLDAISALGSSMIGSLKGVLGIHSPSRAAIEIMHNVSGTLASTADKDAPAVQAAMGSMVDMATPSIAGASAGATQAKAGTTINLTINATGGDAQGIKAAVLDALGTLFGSDLCVIEGAAHA